jgi:hypothetical protein
MTRLLAALLLLVAAPALHADAYTTTMAGALAKYGTVEQVPAASIQWIAKSYGKSPARVRADMVALVPPERPPEAGAEEEPAPPDAPAPAESADATGPTTEAAPLLPTDWNGSALETWAEENGLPPWIFRLARGFFALFLMISAIPLWAASRAGQDASPHMRSATASAGILPKVLALYLVCAGLWEAAGTYDPERFQLGRWVTIVKEIGPPIRDAVKSLPIFKK